MTNFEAGNISTQLLHIFTRNTKSDALLRFFPHILLILAPQPVGTILRNTILRFYRRGDDKRKTGKQNETAIQLIAAHEEMLRAPCEPGLCNLFVSISPNFVPRDNVVQLIPLRKSALFG